MENKPKKVWYKKWWVIILVIVGVLIALAIMFPPPEETNTDKETKKETKTEKTKTEESKATVKKESPAKPTQEKKKTWNEVLMDIVEADTNYGETKTKEFKITSDKWRIKWYKRELASLSIKVFTTDVELYGEGFIADLGKPKEGILNFTGSGTYFVLLVQSTNPDAGVSEIRVEEFK